MSENTAPDEDTALGKNIILRDARLPEAKNLLDIEIQNGVVVAHHKSGKHKSGKHKSGDHKSSDQPDDKSTNSYSLNGMLVLPAMAEPHAHLDKALLADSVQNPTGDLMGAVKEWLIYRDGISLEDYVKRAKSALEIAITNGVTAIRTHLDVGEDIGSRGIMALKTVREEMHKLIDIQIVALSGSPLNAKKESEGNKKALEEAVTELDPATDLVGAAPALDSSPSDCIAFCLELAKERGVGVDFHIDETLDTDTLTILELCRQVKEMGFKFPVTASHCVSLSMQSEAKQKSIAAEIKSVGASVVILPQTNLYLQARGIKVAPPRGLSAVATLTQAGVLVAAGGDNLQDPFNLMGRGDQLEVASLMVAVAHLTPEEAYIKVSESAREVMSLQPVGTQINQVADLVCIEASNVREAIATAPAKRKTFKAGKLIASTDEVRQLV